MSRRSRSSKLMSQLLQGPGVATRASLREAFGQARCWAHRPRVRLGRSYCPGSNRNLTMPRCVENSLRSISRSACMGC